MQNRAGTQKVTFSGNFEYTLTTSSVASDAIAVDYAKRLSLYGYYKGGAGSTSNTVSIIVEVNPFDSSEDSAGAFWSPAGIYIDTSGTWAQESSTFTYTQTTAGTYKNQVPIDFSNVNAKQVRFKAQETVGAGSAGSLKLVVVKNDIF